jgi:hypothetical protein
MAKLDNDNKFIFHQRNHTETKREVEYYSMIGDHDYLDQDNRPRSNEETNLVVAKSIKVEDRPKRFYVKVGNHGRIFNPIGLFSEGTHTKFLSKIGRKEWEFKEVNQKVFDLYINFLTTKNIAWLTNAEREMQ